MSYPSHSAFPKPFPAKYPHNQARGDKPDDDRPGGGWLLPGALGRARCAMLGGVAVGSPECGGEFS